MSWSNGQWVDDPPLFQTWCPTCSPSYFEPGQPEAQPVYCYAHMPVQGVDDGKVTGDMPTGAMEAGGVDNAALCALIHHNSEARKARRRKKR